MKQTKKLLSVFLSFVMLLSITAGLDFSPYADVKNIVGVYEKVLDKYYNDCNINHDKNFYGGCNICGYALYDIDDNGIFELIIEEGTCEQNRTHHVYTLTGENVKYLGSYNAWHLALYGGKGKMKGVDGGSGVWSIYDIIINSKGVKKVFIKNIEATEAPSYNNSIYFEELANKIYLHEFIDEPCFFIGHEYVTVKIKKSTLSKNGSIVKKCSLCGEKNTKLIAYPKTITLSKTSYTYGGKAKNPSVTVKDSKGSKIDKKYYSVSYSSGRKNVGKYTVTIKFKGNYSGTVKKTFTIKPKLTTVSKLTAGKKAFTAKWKKQSAATGYQIQYSTSSKFKGAKTITVSKNKTTSKKVSKLKAKKKYYVRIRTYKTVKVNGKSTKVYSSWSKAKSVKTK